jgi:hypothetical protein
MEENCNNVNYFFPDPENQKGTISRGHCCASIPFWIEYRYDFSLVSYGTIYINSISLELVLASYFLYRLR